MTNYVSTWNCCHMGLWALKMPMKKSFNRFAKEVRFSADTCRFMWLSETPERWKRTIQTMLNCLTQSAMPPHKRISCNQVFCHAVRRASTEWTVRFEVSTKDWMIYPRMSSSSSISKIIFILQMSLVSSLLCFQAEMSLAFIWMMTERWGWHPTFRMHWKGFATSERSRQNGLWCRLHIKMAQNFKFVSLNRK